MLTAILALSVIQSQGMDVRLMRFPDVYGDRIVFTYASDLWVVGTEGGIARRLTSHPGLEYRAKFSPDGKWIAFSGQYDGDTDVYVVASEGGEPKRLTFNAGSDLVSEWTPDGRIAFVAQREQLRPGPLVLWYVKPEGGMPVKSEIHEAYDVSFSPDGRNMAYNRVSSQNYNWRRYRGGVQGKVSFWDFATKQYSEMATGREQNYYPMWVGPSTVYYASDVNQGTLNIFKYDVRSKAKTQVTRFNDADVRWPSTDGRSIVFERNGRMYLMNLADNNVREVQTRVLSDQLRRRPVFKNVAQWIDGVSISPSAARLAVTARGDLYTVPASTGETRNLTMTQDSREESPVWSPDGQAIAFISDKSGVRKIYTIPQMGGDWKAVDMPDSQNPALLSFSPDSKKLTYTTDDQELFIVDIASGTRTLVFDDPQGIASFDWSKDAKWIAYIRTQPNLFGAIYLYDVEKNQHHKVTEGFYNDSAVTFDLNGKYLYFVSQRTFGFAPGDFEIGLQQENTQRVYVVPLKADMRNPLEEDDDEEPVKTEGEQQAGEQEKKDEPAIDVEGLGRRAIALPLPASGYPFVVGANNGVFTWSEGTLIKFDLASKQPQPIIAGATMFDFTPDRTKLVYNFGPNFGITPVRPNVQPGTGRVSMADLTMVVDPAQEWRQIMRDAWLYEKHNFYDKGIAGLDWDAIGRRYIAMVDSAGDRSDVNYIMGMMIGELGTGHAYNGGGDFGQPVGNPNTGMLGVDYEAVGEYVVLKKVYRGLNFEEARRGPLGAPGIHVKDGEYLLEIDGQPVRSNMDPNSLLVGKANKDVRIKVAGSSSGLDAREYVVTTIGSENELRYIEWVEDNRKRVAEMTNGRVGYVHVPNTQVEGILEFIKGYYAQSDKEAFIVDERYNGGGFIPTFFGERLLRRVVTGIQQRHGDEVFYPPQTWDGPKVMLINRYAGSGGDHFPWLFRHLGVGPLIGTRTWGGLVGISGGRNLVDGGNVTAPEFALYDINTGEIIAENKGIDPDIEVDDTPDLVSRGRDPELEAAVKYLLEQLAKSPPKEYAKPKFLTGGG